MSTVGSLASSGGGGLPPGSIPVYPDVSSLPSGANPGDQAFVISDLFEFNGTTNMWELIERGSAPAIEIIEIDASQNPVVTDLGLAPSDNSLVNRYHVLNDSNQIDFISNSSPVSLVDAPFQEGDIIEAWSVLTRRPIVTNFTQPDGQPNTVRWIIEPGVIELTRGSNGGLFNAITGGGFQSGNNTGCRWYNDEFAPAGNTNFQQAYDGAIGDNFTVVTNEFVEPLSGPNAGSLIPFNGVGWQVGGGGGFSVDVSSGTEDIPSWSVQRITQSNRVNKVSSFSIVRNFNFYPIGSGNRVSEINLEGTINTGWRAPGGQHNQAANGSSGVMRFQQPFLLSAVQIQTFGDIGAQPYQVDVEGEVNGAFVSIGSVNGVHGTDSVLDFARTEYTAFRFTWVSSGLGQGVRGGNINFGIDFRTVVTPTNPIDADEFRLINNTNQEALVNTPTGPQLLDPGRSLLLMACDGVFHPGESLQSGVPEAPVENNIVTVINPDGSGYQDVGDIRRQWGIYPGGDNGTQLLSVPFADTNYVVSLTCDARTGAAPGDNGARLACVENKTTNQFGIETNGTAIAFSWIAIGLKP